MNLTEATEAMLDALPPGAKFAIAGMHDVIEKKTSGRWHLQGPTFPNPVVYPAALLVQEARESASGLIQRWELQPKEST